MYVHCNNYLDYDGSSPSAAHALINTLSEIPVGMRVVEMFWQYNRQGRKDIITNL